MSSKLFAFRVARPLEVSQEEDAGAVYDPQAQTSVWSGEPRAIAAYCTVSSIGGRRYCNTSSGGFCNTYGTRRRRYGYFCD